MKSAAWLIGKMLQLLGLMTVGYALFIGLQTSDSKQEVQLLGFGAVEFLIGLFILKASSGGNT